MTTFTDDDLKQLKDFVKRHELQPDYTVHTANGVMEALLARLEAAEKALAWSESLTTGHLFAENVIAHVNQFLADLDIWRKAAGKEKGARK